MSAYALWALLLVLVGWFTLATVAVAAFAYLANRRDRAWEAEHADDRDDRDAAWRAHVSEALAAASETPIGDAVAARIAARLAADVDREWEAMQG